MGISASDVLQSMKQSLSFLAWHREDGFPCHTAHPRCTTPHGCGSVAGALWHHSESATASQPRTYREPRPQWQVLQIFSIPNPEHDLGGWGTFGHWNMRFPTITYWATEPTVGGSSPPPHTPEHVVRGAAPHHALRSATGSRERVDGQCEVAHAPHMQPSDLPQAGDNHRALTNY